MIARRKTRLPSGLLAVVLCLSGCATIVENTVDNVSTNLTLAMMAQDDPETVRQAAPAYLLLLDSFVQGKPESPSLLRSAAALYSAYGSVFVDDPDRARKLTGRAFHYSKTSVCIEYPQACDIGKMSFDGWQEFLDQRSGKDAEAMYGLATSWLAYVQAHSSDWEVLAQVPKAEALLNRLEAVSGGYEQGNIFLFLGVLNSIRPPALGGHPEKGRDYFEKAISLSEGTDLSAKVSFARVYARTLYDRELHDRLLNEVLAADPATGHSTLLNVMAQDEARRLLKTADDYF